MTDFLDRQYDLSNGQLAVDLQKGHDVYLSGQMDHHSSKVDSAHNRIAEIKNMILQLRTIRNSDPTADHYDLTESQIIQFTEAVWPEIQAAYPSVNLTLENLEGIELNEVPAALVDKIEHQLGIVETREERGVPQMMLELEKHTEVFRIVSDILRKVVEDEIEAVRMRNRKQTVG
ncbi:MAG: hypothetical protein S4CHLAM102_03570 [Chlamydiia bacterium]|nr:hypothetical protein [Chlamydiia bacterium]